MAKHKIPATSAIRELKRYNIAFRVHLYRYQDHGGTRVAAEELGVEEHRVIKTLVLKDQDNKPLIVLMHGDREVSMKNLARAAGIKAISPCDPASARRYTGYQVGGISPFGTLRKLTIFVEESILGLPSIYINGGQRGLLVEIEPSALTEVLAAAPVNAGR